MSQCSKPQRGQFVLIIRYCFGIRASDFEFEATLYSGIQRIS